MGFSPEKLSRQKIAFTCDGCETQGHAILNSIPSYGGGYLVMVKPPRGWFVTEVHAERREGDPPGDISMVVGVCPSCMELQRTAGHARKDPN